MNNNNTSFELVIIIPCFNEEKRLPVAKYTHFLSTNKKVFLCFVNDGSSDKTDEVVLQIKNKFQENIHLLSLDKNLGKAVAVKAGMNYCQQHYNYQKIAYLDADLATSLEECYEISLQIKNEIVVAFGSRIQKIDTFIDRKKLRFLIGRIIATFISMQLQLKVYDTQCGCKIFDKNTADAIFKDNFISKWLFDVEIFHRLIQMYGKENMPKICSEIPLKKWIDVDESSVKISYFFKLWFDLMAIKKKYQS